MGADHDGVSGLATVCLLRCSGVTKQKGRAPLEALPCTAMSADFIFCCLFFEALPLIMPLNLAGGS
jgi:hypothetical protein